jgi:hypothetical protein
MRSLLSPAAIVLLISIPRARATSVANPSPTPPNARTEHTASRASRAGRGHISPGSDAPGSAKPIPALRPRMVASDREQLIVDPPTVDFGMVPVGSGAEQTSALIAPDSEVTILSVNVSDPEFNLGGLSFPLTIPAGGRQQYTVTFTPQAVGGASATLSFLSSGGDTVTVQNLTGIGGPSSAHSVNISWDASISRDVVGYNVYRAKRSDGPYRKIGWVLASTIYTDASVSDGGTYYYVTTAVDSSGQESVYSNEVRAVVP